MVAWDRCLWCLFLSIWLDDASLDCDFEEASYPAACDWKSSWSDTDQTWTWTQGCSNAPTSPVVAGEGQCYIFYETSGSTGETSYFTSPVDTITKVAFFYNMYGYDLYGIKSGALSLECDVSGAWTTAWSLSGNQGDVWIYVGVDISPASSQCRFAGRRGSNYRDVAIDALVVGSPLRGGAGLSRLCEISRAAEFPDLDAGAAWSIYLDDTTIIQKVAAKAVADLSGKSPDEQLRLKQAFSWWGIPTNAGKAVQRAQEAERLGALLDGRNGVLRTTTRRSLELISLGSWIRQRKEVDRKTLQIYAGKAIHILQFRRCLFSCLEVIFGMIAHGPPRMPVTEAPAD
eukprot:s1238_g14.t1